MTVQGIHPGVPPVARQHEAQGPAPAGMRGGMIALPAASFGQVAPQQMQAAPVVMMRTTR